MLVLYIFILMFTNSINHLQKNIHSAFINRIILITLLISILLTFNTLYFQSIGKGISIYNGIFQTTLPFATQMQIHYMTESCRSYLGFIPIQVEWCTVEDYLNGASSLLMASKIKRIKTESKDLNPFLYKNKPIFYAFHTKTILYSNRNPETWIRFLRENDLNRNPNDLMIVLRENELNNNESLNRLSLVKNNGQVSSENIADLGINSEIGESFPWFLDEKGKIIDFNQNIKLENGVKLACDFIEKRFKIENSDISILKIMDILKPFAEGKDTTVLEFYNHLSELFNIDKGFFKMSANCSVVEVKSEEIRGDISSLPQKPFDSLGEMTINELCLKLKNLEFPLMNVDVSLDLFKVVPTLWIYRGVVKTYIILSYPLSDLQKMHPSLVDDWIKWWKSATRLWSAFFASIVTVTFIVFLQRSFLTGVNILLPKDTFNPVLPNTLPTSGEGKGVGSSVKNALSFLFFSNIFKPFFKKLKKMTIGQFIYFLLKSLTTLLFLYLFIYYNVEPSAIISYLATITLYDLAKIWLVGNVGGLLYFICGLIIYIHYCNRLDKGERRENIKISHYWPTFISNWLNSLLVLSTGSEDFKKGWINQYWIKVTHKTVQVFWTFELSMV